MWTTTLNKILSRDPCEGGWYELLQSLNKTRADDVPISLGYILKSNGLEDAIWALRTVNGHDEEIRLFAVVCARQIQHLMSDPRSIQALDVAERFATGRATNEERTRARLLALAAIQDAAGLETIHASSAAFYTLGANAAAAASLVFSLVDKALNHIDKSSWGERGSIARASFRLKQSNYFLTMVGENSE